MNINTINFTTADNNSVKVTTTNGIVSFMRYPIDNRHKEKIQAWLDAGNTIDPYVAPMPTQNEIDDNYVRQSSTKDLAIIVIELADALLAKGNISSNDFTPDIRQKYQNLKAAVDRIK